MTKICVVTTSFPRWPGDNRGTFVLEAAAALVRQGLGVRVVAMHSPGASTHEIMDGIEVFRPRYLWPTRLEVLQKEGGGLPEMWRKSRLARLAVGPFMLAHVLAVMRHARQCDVIHANWTLSAVAAWLGQPVHRRPMVVTVQGSDIYQAPRLPLVGVLTRLALNRAFRVLALSRSLAEATQALGVDADRIEIVPNGVDTGRFQPGQAEREPIILFVGSLIERKGVRTLIEALPRVSQACPGYQVVVAGDGPQLGALQALALTVGVQTQVTFVGAQTPEQIQAWMGRASVFVLPSLEEGLGVVLLEALASGTPCVASRVGGIPDVVTPDTGELVPPGDPVALADALVRVLANPVRRAELSRNARRRALELFDWQSIATRLSDIYRAAIERADRNPQSPAGPHEPI